MFHSIWENCYSFIALSIDKQKLFSFVVKGVHANKQMNESQWFRPHFQEPSTQAEL